MAVIGNPKTGEVYDTKAAMDNDPVLKALAFDLIKEEDRQTILGWINALKKKQPKQAPGNASPYHVPEISSQEDKGIDALNGVLNFLGSLTSYTTTDALMDIASGGAAAFVPNSKSYGKFIDEMQEVLRQKATKDPRLLIDPLYDADRFEMASGLVTKGALSPTSVVDAYSTVRHPLIRGKVAEDIAIENLKPGTHGQIDIGILGEYDPVTKDLIGASYDPFHRRQDTVVSMSRQQYGVSPDRMEDFVYDGYAPYLDNPTTDAAETLYHELTHGVQRRQQRFDPMDMGSVRRHIKEKNWYNVPDSIRKERTGFDAYFNAPDEVQARVGGSTGRRGLVDFVHMLEKIEGEGATPFARNYVEAYDFIDEIMELHKKELMDNPVLKFKNSKRLIDPAINDAKAVMEQQYGLDLIRKRRAPRAPEFSKKDPLYPYMEELLRKLKE